MKKLYIPCIAALMLCACTKERLNVIELDNGDKILLGDNSFWNLQSDDVYIGSDPGDYIHFITTTDYIASVHSLKADPLTDEYYSGYNGVLPNCDHLTKSGELPQKRFTVTVNGVNLDREPATRSGKMPDYSGLYGKNVTFSISNTLTRSGGSQKEVEMYIPEQITITTPRIETVEDMYPWCYYKNFKIRWNADPKNEKGIIVIIEWLGTMMYGYDHPQIYKRRYDHIKTDNGEAYLSLDLFEDIPDTALCYMTLMRGSAEDLLIDDYSYKLLGESHVVMPFVLVRNIKQKIK